MESPPMIDFKSVPGDVQKRPAKDKKDYINNKEFTAEIMSCLSTGVLSDKATKYFMLLAYRAGRGLPYKDPRDREDCIQSALFDMVKYWNRFNPLKSMNAFAFYTQMAKNGYAKEYKKIHKNNIEYVSIDFDGDSEIYTL